MPPVGFEFAIPASERPQTHALDRAATEIGRKNHINSIKPRSSGDTLYASESSDDQQVKDLLIGASSLKLSTYRTSDCVQDGSTTDILTSKQLRK
jgi:hypothetical protein